MNPDLILAVTPILLNSSVWERGRERVMFSEMASRQNSSDAPEKSHFTCEPLSGWVRSVKQHRLLCTVLVSMSVDWDLLPALYAGVQWQAGVSQTRRWLTKMRECLATVACMRCHSYCDLPACACLHVGALSSVSAFVVLLIICSACSIVLAAEWENSSVGSISKSLNMFFWSQCSFSGDDLLLRLAV